MVTTDQIHSMVTTVNNTVLCTWKLLRVNLKHSHYLKIFFKKLAMWVDRCVNHHDYGNHPTIYISIK